MKIYEFRLRFHWSLFLRFELTIIQHWFRKWLGADQAISHYLNRWWLVYWRIYTSLSLNESTNLCRSKRPQVKYVQILQALFPGNEPGVGKIIWFRYWPVLYKAELKLFRRLYWRLVCRLCCSNMFFLLKKIHTIPGLPRYIDHTVHFQMH